MKIPPQYRSLMPYLIVNDATSFLDFMKIVFGAEEIMIVPDEVKGIRHGEIKINDAVIMFGQADEHWSLKPAGLFIFVENLDETFAKAVSNGAKVLMAPAVQDYGYTSGVHDPFGNDWWITQGEK